MTVSTPGHDPRGWTVTIAHFGFNLPSRALDLGPGKEMMQEVVLVDVDFHTGKCYLMAKESWTRRTLHLTTYPLFKQSIKKIQEAIDYDARFPFCIY